MRTAHPWPLERFGEVLEIRNGRNQREVENASGPYPIYGSGGVMGYASDYICEANTTIIGRKGSINNPLYVEERFWTVDTAFGLHHKERLHPRFLYYYCLHYDFSKHNRGTTIPSLVKTELLEIRMPIPPLPEQQRIVGKLDAAFAALTEAQAHVERNRANARELFESYLNGVRNEISSNWPEKSLGEVCEYQNGKAHEKCIDPNGKYIVINSKFVSTEGKKFKRSKHNLLPLVPNDIVMVLSDVPNGRALAKCFLVDKANTYTLNQRICVFRSSHFDTNFLFFQLNRNKHFLAFNNGENQTNMRLNQVLSCPLFVPPIAEQKEFESRLRKMSEKAEHLETTYAQKLSELEELKKSILGAAFRGEL
ncbi:MAG: restriction endonuclease subunit S [Flavobacteriales bacterium]|nr:restriction endonuclease subunit S [Flavobacteriales bacterium]